MTDQSKTENKDLPLVIEAIANDMLQKVSLADALSTVNLDAVLGLLKKSAIEKARETANSMPEEELSELAKQIKNGPAENSNEK